ncbi:MAG: SocA family protein [Anaerolineae bacterium]|jgi:uncharacterized phage-associated protein|nr:SocA family protein [Anaerolineae bacterium]
MAIQFKYDPVKTSQAVAFLLQRHGGLMKYLHLIKLLYLADRHALDQWERTITGDSYCSMPLGPVLSKTFDLIKGADSDSYWSTHFRTEQHSLILKTPSLRDKLSDAEIKILAEVDDQYGAMDQWELVDHLHRSLPEYRDPRGSSIPISIEDILNALSVPASDQERIAVEVQAEQSLADLLGVDC